MNRVIILIFFLGACNNPEKVLSREELVRYTLNPDNGLVQTRVHNDIQLRLQYRSRDLVVFQQLNSRNTNFDSVYTALTEYDYFVVELSKGDREIESSYAGGDGSQYKTVTQYLNTRISSDVYAVIDEDIVRVHEAFYIPQFGTGKSTNVLIVFKNLFYTESDEIRIIFEDPIFGSGFSEFVFDTDRIKNIPRLKR